MLPIAITIKTIFHISPLTSSLCNKVPKAAYNRADKVAAKLERQDAYTDMITKNLAFLYFKKIVFADTVHGLLKLSKEGWLCEGTEQTLMDYVSNFTFRLRCACEIARDNLETEQGNMKEWFDKHARDRI